MARSNLQAVSTLTRIYVKLSIKAAKYVRYRACAIASTGDDTLPTGSDEILSPQTYSAAITELMFCIMFCMNKAILVISMAGHRLIACTTMRPR
jgi:hypothetical protein